MNSRWLIRLLAPVACAASCGASLVVLPVATAAAKPTSLAVKIAKKEAIENLDAIVLPPGSIKVASLHQKWLQKAALGVACTPLIDETGFWTDSSTPAHVLSFLRTHPEKRWLPLSPPT